ncbi:MAG: N-acetylmuramoyl-L-alanine amidase [Lachnospiraceae bacterium]|nr:N-acetylmuramoyl-L-alanine amidase [Lachnospiraceae bacterium]
MTQRLRTLLSLFFYGLLTAFMLYIAREAAWYAAGTGVVIGNGKVIVLDAGHGGEDPGKVGNGDIYEKDINLAITGYVKFYLEQNDYQVVMTREKDESLGTTEKGFDKNGDMRARLRAIEDAGAVIAVSIHQNSFTDGGVQGAQVFYHESSGEGQELAKSIQESLWERLDSEKKREIKADNSYYLLKNSSIPMVIVECGFLSNSRELELLQQETYQRQVAWAIYMGIEKYLNAGSEN